MRMSPDPSSLSEGCGSPDYFIACFTLFHSLSNPGSIRHIVKYIREGGPIHKSDKLQINDELLEINGISLVGVTHEEAIEIVRDTAKHVYIVACRVIQHPHDDNDDTVTPPPSNSETGNVYLHVIVCHYSTTPLPKP